MSSFVVVTSALKLFILSLMSNWMLCQPSSEWYSSFCIASLVSVQLGITTAKVTPCHQAEFWEHYSRVLLEEVLFTRDPPEITESLITVTIKRQASNVIPDFLVKKTHNPQMWLATGNCNFFLTLKATFSSIKFMEVQRSIHYLLLNLILTSHALQI